MKNFSLLILFFLYSFSSYSQDFLGLNTGNYAGITGISLQSANVADNRYKFDFNLISASINFDNNFIGFSREYFLKNRFSFKNFNSYEQFKTNVLTENKNLNNDKVNFFLNNKIQLPLSFLLTTSPKSGIAFNLQSRTSIAFQDINNEFAKQVYEFWKYQPTQGKYYNVSGMKINALNWFEAGLTYGRVLLNENKHFLKFGITAKYLGGISSWNLDAKDLIIKADKDSFMTAHGNNILFNRSKSDISTKINSSYRPDANSIGGDIGLVYEFRGRINKFKFIKYNEKENYTQEKLRRDKNKYSAKLGISLLDVGVMKFKSAPLARNFNIHSTNFNMWNLDVRNIQQFDTVISQNVTYTGPLNQEYSIAMPTALSAQLDLHLLKGFYINAMAYLPFKSLNKSTDFRIPTPQYYAVTPRWESRAIGLYVPFSMNAAKVINAGATLRLGPLFVGTSNMLTLIKKDNIQNADVHAGLKIPLAFGKPSKTADWLKKFTNKDTTIENKSVELIENKTIEKTEIINTPPPAPPAPPTTPQPIQIIINNYNYPGGSAMNKKNNVSSQNSTYEIKNTDSSQQQIIIEEKIIEVEDMSSLQSQIEYLKRKLNQKEQIIMEMEKQQLQDNITPESKKKIDSLTGIYLNDTSKVIQTAATTNLSVDEQKSLATKLHIELLEIESKNKDIDEKMANYKTWVNEQLLISNQKNEIEKINEFKTLQTQLVTLETQYPNPIIVTNKEIVTTNPLEKNKITTKHLSTVTSPFPTETTNEKIIQNRQSTNIEPAYKSPDMSNLVTKKDAEVFMTKKEYEILRNEIKQLKDILKNNNDKNTIVAAAPSNTGVVRRRRNKIINNYSTPVSEIKNEIQIVRDTIYIEKPVETIVTQIIRDTITNTIQNNNTVTTIEEKKVFTNNERDLILEADPELILFDVGSFMIKNIYFSKLISFAKKIKKYPELKIHIKGHTDNTGSIEKNRILSKQRADAVKVYLIKQGVNRDNIIVDALGADSPFVENNSHVGKSQNRRVEVKIAE